MLTLPIKKKWYDMILSGEKKEEYRDIKPYYDKRFIKLLGYPENEMDDIKYLLRKQITLKSYKVKFRNGYSRHVPYVIADCRLSIKSGKEEWGAEDGKEYYVLTIQKVWRDS